MAEPIIYLLGGPARTGKTLISLRFNAVSGISIVSTDDLADLVELAAPHLRIGHEFGATWRETRDGLAPFVEGLADIRGREERPILIEGELHPASVKRLMGRFKVRWVNG